TSDCLGRQIETPENTAVTELSTSLTPIETQIEQADLIVLGTIAEISGTCYNQDGGEYYSNALPYFEIRLTVNEYLQQKMAIDAPELVLTAVGYGVMPNSEWPFAVGDQVLAFIVDRELAWKGNSRRPILRPFDDPTSSLLLGQPDGTFVSVGGYHDPLVLPELRAQLPAVGGADEPMLGCAAGGSGVFTPEDVRCYLGSFPAEFVQEIDAETAVLFTDPNAIAEWVGGAIIYHIPTVSSLVLDRNGDVDPLQSHLNGRTALVAYSQLAANTQLLAQLKQTVQTRWQTSDSGQPHVRLSVAWQDGNNTIFMVAIAGLPANDDRFFCPEEAWTIGDEEIRIVADCIALEEGMLVRHLFFSTQAISSSQPLPVQLALNDVPSNPLQVSAGEVGVETAVYQAAIAYHSQRPAIVQQTTTTELFNPGIALADVINQNVLETFVLANQYELDLGYLFLNHNSLFVQPRETIEQYYLPATADPPDCDRFRQEYTGLGGGVVTLSQIALSGDGQQALLFLKRECGVTAVSSSYLLLEKREGAWVIIGEYGKLPMTNGTLLEPGLVYNGQSRGCGSIFVYKANDDAALSAFLTVSIAAADFPLTEEPITLEIADYPEQITVNIDLFGGRVYDFGEFPYCNDVGPQAEPQAVWSATSGSLTLSVNGPVPEEPCQGDGFE
ncbi:MAG: hypothetical protein KDE56_28125, partial [Anaerolineales bacterium]|nr:hypothetical protein [Anaerolineales bacterium]